MKKNSQKIDSFNNKEKNKKSNLEIEQQDSSKKLSDEGGDKDLEEEIHVNENGEQENEEVNDETEVEQLQKKCDESFDKMQKVAADFENYKRRVAKEKQTTYADALVEAVETFLPLMDNFERALKTPSECENDPFRKGVEMLFNQFEEAIFKLGVKKIKSVGETFDPKLHNAVMHVEDDSFSDGEIIEELQKGYILGEKVIRHSMVKVAN